MNATGTRLSPATTARLTGHRSFWGPLGLIIVTGAAGLPRAWLAAGLAWAFHVAFDCAIGLRLRSLDGFQRDSHT